MTVLRSRLISRRLSESQLNSSRFGRQAQNTNTSGESLTDKVEKIKKMPPSLSILGIWLKEARVSEFNSSWIRMVKTFCRFFCDVTKEWSAAQSAVTSCGCAVSLWWCSCGNLVGRSISSCCLNLPETRCSLAQLKRWNGQLGSSEFASGICIFCDPCPILVVWRPTLAGATWISNFSFLFTLSC